MFLTEYLLPVLSSVVMFAVAVYILSKFLYKSAGFRPAIIGIIVTIASIVAVPINNMQMPWLNMLSFCAIFTVINHILFKGNFAVRFGFAAIVLTLNGISESIVILLTMILGELQLTEVVNSSAYINVLGFLTPVIFLVLGRVIARVFPRKYVSFRWSDLFLVSFQIFSMASMAIMMGLTASAQSSFTANLSVLLLQIVLLTFSILIFFIYDSALHKRELEKQVEVYRYQFDQIKNSQAAIGKIQHDIEKHLLALKLDIGNAKPEEAERKIDRLIGDMRHTVKVADSGNADIDAILNYKAKQASEFGIRIYCDLRLPYTLHMNTTDLSVILCNALDNAIEACKQVEPAERVIGIVIIYEKTNLRMLFENPSAGDITASVAGEIASTKQGGMHGIGLISIKETVGKYDGLMDITAENNRFALKIMLFNLQSK